MQNSDNPSQQSPLTDKLPASLRHKLQSDVQKWQQRGEAMNAQLLAGEKDNDSSDQGFFKVNDDSQPMATQQAGAHDADHGVHHTHSDHGPHGTEASGKKATH